MAGPFAKAARGLLIAAVATTSIGVLAAAPASADSDGAALVPPPVIVSYWSTERECEAAGANGLYQGAWYDFVCFYSSSAHAWALDVDYHMSPQKAPVGQNQSA